MIKIFGIYLLMMNIIGFVAMGIDKKRAIKNEWRIKEKTLFLFSLVGGSVGTWGGMYFFRHKTKHLQFVIGFPLILAMQIVVFAIILKNIII